MTDEKITVLIDSAKQDSRLPAMDQAIRCPDHPDEEPSVGFGLAGGGFGPYTVCPVCCRILSKDQSEE